MAPPHLAVEHGTRPSLAAALPSGSPGTAPPLELEAQPEHGVQDLMKAPPSSQLVGQWVCLGRGRLGLWGEGGVCSG